MVENPEQCNSLSKFNIYNFNILKVALHNAFIKSELKPINV